ncbi:MAG: ABC transporter permease [Armatimonadota bacterium]
MSAGARRLLRDPRLTVGGALLVLVVTMAVVAPWVAPHDPLVPDFLNNLVPPGPGHLLGTDRLGRDILSRVVFGGRYSLGISMLSVTVGSAAGTAIGVASGYFGGRVDLFAMRIVDGFLAFPTILLALIVVATFGSSFGTLVGALAIAILPNFARILRGAVLGIRSLQYIEAARALGGSDVRVMLRHVLPNVIATLLVTATFTFGTVLLAEASLAFLGLGIPKPAPTWGGMVSEGREFLTTAPWVALFPGLVIMLSVLAANLLGDAARDASDPTLRYRR